MLLVLILCFLSVVDKAFPSPPMYNDSFQLEEELKLSKAQNQFSIDLFHKIVANGSYQQNVFYSPYSVFSALLTVYVASEGNTESLLERVLRFEPSSKPNKSYIKERIFQETLNQHSKEYELTSVDRIFYTPDIQVVPSAKKEFGEKVAEFKTNTEINEWISKQTKGVIPILLDEKDKPHGGTIMFVNAAYFKAYWANLLTGKPVSSDFNNHLKVYHDVHYMTPLGGRASLNLWTDHDLQAHTITIPYKGDDISMIIIKPMDKNDLSSFLNRLTSSKLQSLVSTLKEVMPCDTDLRIPKFESDKKYELKKIFESLGDGNLFSQKLNLSNIFKPGQDLGVKDVIHRAIVKVNEKGTEAAATTAAVVAGSTECQKTFFANETFIYIIYDNTHRFIHHMGLLYDPSGR